MDLDQHQLADIVDQLRDCRAMILSDAEAFQRVALRLEHIAQLAGAPVGVGLAKSRRFLFKVLENEDQQLREEANALFEVVREARNMAVHDGAWVRQRSSQLVELLLILEAAVVQHLKTVAHLMVKTVAVAETWHSLARVRRMMLSNSFSFLPICKGQWQLLSDEAIVLTTRSSSSGTKRNERLASTVENALDHLDLQLKQATIVYPDQLISGLFEQPTEWPLLVTEEGKPEGRLLGLLTPFDLL